MSRTTLNIIFRGFSYSLLNGVIKCVLKHVRLEKKPSPASEKPLFSVTFILLSFIYLACLKEKMITAQNNYVDVLFLHNTTLSLITFVS
jgi:hypothetical protein